MEQRAHGLEVWMQPGNALCAQCHMPAKFDAAEHHHHQPGSTGARRVNCHMPTKTYMVVDVRRDHGFRVPRPDLSVALGTPNACTQCHKERSAERAAQTVDGWYPGGRQTPRARRHCPACRAGRDCRCGTAARSAHPRSESAGNRAGERFAISAALFVCRLGSGSAGRDRRPDPLVRSAVPRGFPVAPPRVILQAAAPLLSDPVRAVRIAAARELAGTDLLALAPGQQTAFVKAAAELVAAEMVDAERPEAHLNLGPLDMRRRNLTEAE
jgi:hypothetical protein